MSSKLRSLLSTKLAIYGPLASDEKKYTMTLPICRAAQRVTIGYLTQDVTIGAVLVGETWELYKYFLFDHPVQP